MNNNILVILAGGIGARYRADRPKQYTLINGRELIEYTITEMSRSSEMDKMLVVLNDDPDEMERVRKHYNVEVVRGGKERADSFQNAINYVKERYPQCRKIIFHEAARPLLQHDVIDKYFKLLDEYDYVESCKKISDSLGSYVVNAPRREDYYLIQAPEAYRFPVLDQYYDHDSDIYFAANQFPDFLKGYQYFGIENNIKLTTPQDKVIIEYLLKQREKDR